MDIFDLYANGKIFAALNNRALPEAITLLAINYHNMIQHHRHNVFVDIEVIKRFSSSILHMDFYFAESTANILTDIALNPVAKIPEPEVCAYA